MISKFGVRDDEKVISDIVKVYPDFTKIVVYHNSYVLNKKKLITDQKKIISNLKDDRALRRAKSTVKDLILCNNFSHFCTFTFDGKKHNRYDVDHCKNVMHYWLKNQRKNSPDLKYLIVSEFHKDKALHFHALFENYLGRLRKLKLKTKSGRDIYNIPGWRAGKISSAVPIDDKPEAVANYMLKQYFIKDMPLFSGKKRYWCSQNLTRPKTTVNGIVEFGLSKVVRNTTPDYINDIYEIQYHNSRGSKLDSKELTLDFDFYP